MALKIVGNVANTYNLDGSLKIVISTSHPEKRFKAGNKIYFNGIENPFTISSSNQKNDKVYIIKLKEFSEINQVLNLIGRDVLMDVEKETNEYYVDELLNLDVYDLKNNYIGKITHVVLMPVGYYLVIDNTKYLPFDENKFINSISLDKKIVFITDLALESLNV